MPLVFLKKDSLVNGELCFRIIGIIQLTQFFLIDLTTTTELFFFPMNFLYCIEKCMKNTFGALHMW